MGLFDWLKGSGGKAEHLEKSSVAVAPAPVARPSATEVREQLWHATSGRDVKALVDGLNDAEAISLVELMDLNEIPLNAFCTQAFRFNDLDDRMVAATFVALRLLEARRTAPLAPLLEKFAKKFEEKVQHGASASGASFQSVDPWRLGESLMQQTHVLAIELLKRDGYEETAATLLDALLLDYPDRLESSFWRAAARHNLYMQNKNPERKQRALQAIDSFVGAAKNRADFRGNVEALEKMRRDEY